MAASRLSAYTLVMRMSCHNSADTGLQVNFASWGAHRPPRDPSPRGRASKPRLRAREAERMSSTARVFSSGRMSSGWTRTRGAVA
jgi:hypothetical protein